MRVLVTGIAGFVGGHLVDHLRREAPEATLFGLVRPHGSVPEGPGAGVRLLEADLSDAASMEAAVEVAAPDRIVHLAGQSSVHVSWLDPGATLRNNVLGLVHLMDALRKRRLRPRTLVVGSAEEYGMVEPKDLPLGEQAPLRPCNPYAVSKVAQGLLAREYVAPEGIPVIRTRTFQHTGPGRGEAFAESSFAKQIAEIEAGLREPVLHVGNLDSVRDYTDVRDVVRAYWALLEKGQPGEVFNVCSGRGLRIGDLMESLVGLALVKVDLRVDPERLRPADVPALVGDPRRLREATGWEPRIPLAETLRDLLEDWRRRVFRSVPALPRR